MPQPPIAQQLARKLIAARFGVEADVKVVLQVGHQAVEVFEVCARTNALFEELETGIARQQLFRRQLAQDSFNGALFARLVVIAQPAVVVLEVSLAIHPQHFVAVDALDSFGRDRLAVLRVRFGDLREEDLQEVRNRRADQLQHSALAGGRKLQAVRLRQFIQEGGGDFGREGFEIQLLEIVDGFDFAELIEHLINPNRTGNQKSDLADARIQA